MCPLKRGKITVYFIILWWKLREQFVVINEIELLVGTTVNIPWENIREIQLRVGDNKAVLLHSFRMPYLLNIKYLDHTLNIEGEVSILMTQKPAKRIIEQLKLYCPDKIIE